MKNGEIQQQLLSELMARIRVGLLCLRLVADRDTDSTAGLTADTDQLLRTHAFAYCPRPAVSSDADRERVVDAFRSRNVAITKCLPHDGVGDAVKRSLAFDTRDIMLRSGGELDWCPKVEDCSGTGGCLGSGSRIAGSSSIHENNNARLNLAGSLKGIDRLEPVVLGITMNGERYTLVDCRETALGFSSMGLLHQILPPSLTYLGALLEDPGCSAALTGSAGSESRIVEGGHVHETQKGQDAELQVFPAGNGIRAVRLHGIGGQQ